MSGASGGASAPDVAGWPTSRAKLEGLIAARLRADGWPGDSAAETASAALALIEGALLLARVSGQMSHLANAKRSAHSLLAAPTIREERTRRRSEH